MTENAPIILSLTILMAFILDLFLGDPPFLPHPIRWMGWAISRWERHYRSRGTFLKKDGMVFTTVMIATTWCLSLILVKAAYAVSPWVGGILETVMIYFCLAARSLQEAAREVGKDLRSHDLPAARRSVAMIVGRETDCLNEVGVSRATVETVAENLVDGVIAPLFYAVIGGAPLAMAYKMVNTLDSMIGYKNERYRDFGWAAARLDDVANWLPARLTVPLVALAAAILNGRWQSALALARRDGQKHTSPNAGLSEAAFAGALAVRLGGPNRYHGMTVSKPWIGAEFNPVRTVDIDRACDLMLLTAVLALLTLWGLPKVAIWLQLL
jgi:adenosylcobinamide-phosphate synthase